jgi:ferredoxin
MRFNKNECNVCISNCHADALIFGDDIAIDADKCTLCMVCVSECPADCFDIKGEDFFAVLARLRKVQNSVAYPVLGCKGISNIDAHEKMVCLGVLSEEHLMAIKVFIDKPVLLNLTSCHECKNSFVVDAIKERISAIKENVELDVSDKVLLVERKADLKFEEVSYDRRGFFSAMKNLTFLKASDLFETDKEDIIHAYSQKKLPLKRDIFNTIIKRIKDEGIRERLLQEYAFTIIAGDSCDNCFACIGMCPTGALKIKSDDSGLGLLFNSSMCSGCGLCRDFCMNEAITLSHGYSGDNFFEHEICNKKTIEVNMTGDGSREDTVEAECYKGQ